MSESQKSTTPFIIYSNSVLMNKVVITGSSGLIGTSLFRELRNNYQLILIDNRYPKYDLNKCSQFILKDIRELTKDDLEGAIGIIHLAAVSRVIWGEERPLETWSVNVEGTQHLLNLALFVDTVKWIIYGSSREVYGEPTSFPVSDGHSLAPLNRYGVSKLAAEGLLNIFHKNTQIPALSLRFSNVYGSLFDQMDRVIPKFILQALNNEPLKIEGNQNTFDFTHINDTIKAIISAIKYLENGRITYDNKVKYNALNICTGRETKLLELGQLIIRLTNSSSSIQEVSPRSYDVKNFRGDWKIANNLLSYKPEIELEQGLKDYIELIRSQMIEVQN